MIIPLISIGNSKGIRLSKTVLEKYHFGDSVEMVLEKHRIILKPAAKARNGWSAVFREMRERNGDKLLISDVMTDEHFEEWE